jgi:hypothetical protein
MFRIVRRQQIFPLRRQTAQKQLKAPSRAARSSWVLAFTKGLADIGEQRAMPAGQYWSNKDM